MTQQEIKRAQKLLQVHTDRLETAILDGGGQCLTAHWIGGGQRLFYALDEVEAWVNDRPLAKARQSREGE